MKKQEWLAERIWDIMHYKNLSLRSLYRLVGLGSNEELRRHLNGTSPLTPMLVEKLAGAFKISLDRLHQRDQKYSYDLLETKLSNQTDPVQVAKEVNRLVKIAVGVREKAVALRLLGWSYLNQGDIKSAHESWTKAYKLASKRDPRRKLNIDILFKSLLSLGVFMVNQKQYTEAMDLLDESLQYFEGESVKLGRIHHIRAMCLYYLGDKEAARSHYMLSQQCYENAGDLLHVGIVLGNRADIEFHDGNVQLSLDLLDQAIKIYPERKSAPRISWEKDYARNLICLGRNEEALAVVGRQLELVHSNVNIKNELLGKLLLIKADLTQQAEYAEKAVHLDGISRQLICCLADVLTKIHIIGGDKEAALKYYDLMKECSINGVENYRNGVWF